MDKLKKFAENLLNSEIKDFHQLSGGASAEKFSMNLTKQVDLGAGMLWSLLVEKQFQEKY